MHAYLVTFHVDSFTALHQRLLNSDFKRVVPLIFVCTIVIVRSSVSECGLEHLQLLKTGLHIVADLELFESECFVHEASVH